MQLRHYNLPILENLLGWKGNSLLSTRKVISIEYPRKKKGNGSFRRQRKSGKLWAGHGRVLMRAYGGHIHHEHSWTRNVVKEANYFNVITKKPSNCIPNIKFAIYCVIYKYRRPIRNFICNSISEVLKLDYIFRQSHQNEST